MGATGDAYSRGSSRHRWWQRRPVSAETPGVGSDRCVAFQR